jgi:phage terminase small subunit
MPDERPLSPKQARFVEEYLVDMNGRQAAIRAGYSAKTAQVAASQMLTIHKIQSALAEAMAARSQRTGIAVDRVLCEIALLAQSDVSDYEIDPQGDVHLRPGAPLGAMRAVQSLRKRVMSTAQGTVVETEIRLHPKTPNLRMLGEHLGLFRPTGTEVPDIHIHVEAARERLTDRLKHLATRHAEDGTNGH